MALDSPAKDPRAVDAWLQSYELGEYAAGIKDAGYSSMRFLVAANGADLEEVMAEVGMKRAHAKVFTAAWAELVASGGGGTSVSSRRSSAASSQSPSLSSNKGSSAGDAAVDDGDAERVGLLIPPPQPPAPAAAAVTQRKRTVRCALGLTAQALAPPIGQVAGLDDHTLLSVTSCKK